HRDLKPANVLIAAAGEVPKIADFGMARATSFAGVDRTAMTILGTPDYMAPESLDPLAVDPRSDLYALGCILFEMTTGRPPYTAATPFGVLQQHREAEIPPVPKDFSDGLRALIESLLAKSPADRPQAAATVAMTLSRIAAGEAETRALALPSRDGGAACAGCGHPLILEIGACMNCGLVTARIEPGPCTLLVTGPGSPGDKLDSNLRERLVDWITRNPGLRMAPGALGETIPRVPFTLATRVSRASAEAVGASLKRLHLEFEVVEGGPLKSKPMRKKATTMAGRTAAILAAMSGVFAQSAWILFSVPLILVVMSVGVAWQAARRKTTALPASEAALPPALGEAVRRVERALPAIDAPRHRHGLRAAVSRALTLSRTADDPETAAELASAVDLATVAAGRLAELDKTLQRRDLREPSAEERAMLHERDRWAARLLDLTATLDAFQARIASARAGVDRGAATRLEDPLEDLRVRVEALEEIKREVEGA
ncbi:MAG: protein kinase, partial [Myxococcales bacterium]|nr:protein kinase [Myxococcales bacterium]